MRRNNINPPESLRRKPNSIVRLILAVIVVILSLGSSAYYGWSFIKKMGYFKIGEVVYRGECVVDLASLKGENIFALDLEKEIDYLQGLFPAYKKIRMFRVLPNRLFVDFLNRRPIAYVKLYRLFCIDDEGVLFDIPAQLRGFGLPLILGLEDRQSNAKLSNRHLNRGMNVAIEIIQEVHRDSFLKNFSIKKIDVANPANVSFFMVANSKQSNTPAGQWSNALEIRIGQGQIKNKIHILGRLLAEVDFSSVKYIDLRFREPVIKFNNA